MRISLDLDKSLEENAADYFDKAKKARAKKAGAERAIIDTEKQLRSRKAAQQQAERAVQLPAAPTHWYHKHHWSLTRNGHLLVGGANADANEVLIKKHTEPDDIVFHTDMAGSPFVILKPDGEVGEEDLEDAAQFCACYSRAWKAGMASLEVLYVEPEQVTKEAQSGEYLPKGAFMIRGDTTYKHPDIILGIGLREHEGTLPEVFAGSPAACETHCTRYLRISPGNEKTSDVAKELRRRLGGGDLDAYIKALPAGGCRIL